MPVSHTFVSAIPDDPTSAAAGEVLPSHWNATHTAAIAVSEITATGTPDSTTFLRGDSTWGTPPVTAPAGTDTYFQYNNAGAFGATARMNWNSGGNTLFLGDVNGGALVRSGVTTAGGGNLIDLRVSASTVGAGGAVNIFSGAGGTGASASGGNYVMQSGNGGATTGSGGSFTMTSGNGTTAGSGGGGSFSMSSGQGGSVAGGGGAFSMTAGQGVGTSSGNGGALTMTAGAGTANAVTSTGGAISCTGGAGRGTTTGTGGAVTLTTGAGLNAGNSGAITLNTGAPGATGTAGTIDLQINSISRLLIGATGLVTASYAVKTTATTVAGLPAAATVGAGTRSLVTNATVTTFASVVVGGGANGVPVYSDGTNWRIG